VRQSARRIEIRILDYEAASEHWGGEVMAGQVPTAARPRKQSCEPPRSLLAWAIVRNGTSDCRRVYRPADALPPAAALRALRPIALPVLRFQLEAAAMVPETTRSFALGRLVDDLSKTGA
jgi:hypothetical protein